MANSTWTLLTPPSQGAIAIVQLEGDVDVELEQLTGRTKWSTNALHLVTIPDIDEVVAVKIDDSLAFIMPHGGVHILRKFAIRFEELAIEQIQNPQYPEASGELETHMLRALSIAKSPLAVELLLKQPSISQDVKPTQSDVDRSDCLNHLIIPPTVVLLGAPNTGKSTLMNALTKQDTSIVHELPGATRDAVGSRINCGGLVIDLYDLPGFRESDDYIEQEAIALAKTIATEAVLTLLIADDQHDWLETSSLSLRVSTKSDVSSRDDCDFAVSSHSGEGLQALSIAIRDAIVPPECIEHEGPWLFYSPTEE